MISLRKSLKSLMDAYEILEGMIEIIKGSLMDAYEIPHRIPMKS